MEPKPPQKPSPRPVMDIMAKPRQNPSMPPVEVASVPMPDSVPDPAPELQPITDAGEGEKKPKRRKKWVIALCILLVLVLGAVAAGIGVVMWYEAQLQSVSSDKKAARVRITIEPGTTPEKIGELLQEKGVIRSSLAFVYYTRNKGVQGSLQAGTFSLSPNDTLAAIVDHLVAGKTDEFSITFLPGNTVAAHKDHLLKAGYSVSEVDQALSKQYTHPVLAGKPPTADLEGYIFGETYTFLADTSVEQIITRTFDELYAYIKKHDLETAFQKQGLSLYEGITLASIIQREVADTTDSKQVAQVFFKRLKEGYPLGADATFVYAARKAGVTPSVNFDSPYNTRIHTGLPPGPISSPGLTALLAVATPAPGDFLYFVSGDDGKTYFSKTLAEHEALTAQHCKKNCSLF